MGPTQNPRVTRHVSYLAALTRKWELNSLLLLLRFVLSFLFLFEIPLFVAVLADGEQGGEVLGDGGPWRELSPDA